MKTFLQASVACLTILTMLTAFAGMIVIITYLSIARPRHGATGRPELSILCPQLEHWLAYLVHMVPHRLGVAK